MTNSNFRGTYLMGRYGFTVVLALALPGSVRAQDEVRAYRQIAYESGHGTQALKKGQGDNYYAVNHFDKCVWKFSGSGSTVGRISSVGMGPADLLVPKDLAVDRAGSVIIADSGADRVKVFSQQGDLQNSFPYKHPQHVAVLSDGSILVSGFPRDGLISVLDKQGRIVREIGTPAKVVDIPFLNAIHNMGTITVDAEDDIFFVFEYMVTPTVRKYRPDGTLLAEWHFEGGETLAKNVQRAKGAFQKNKDSGQKAGSYGGVPVLTAAAYDEDTKSLWIASGQQLTRLDSSGQEVRTVKVVRPDGRPLSIDGIIVQRDVIQASSFLAGIFEFPKPR
jgi:hypothetical protein